MVGSKLRATLETGRRCHAQGKLSQAEQQYKQALQIQAGQPEALHALGLIAYQMGDFNAAMKWIEAAIENNPDAPQFYYHAGVILIAQKSWNKAVHVLKKAVTIKPDYSDAHYNMALAWKEMGRYDEAIEHFTHAIRVSNDDADAYYNLGNIYKSLNQPDVAIANYRLAIEKNKKFPEAHNNMGLVLKEQGLVREAIDHYRTAIRLNPEFAEAHWNLSLGLLLMEQFKEGWEEYEWRFLKPNPEGTYPHRFTIPYWDGSRFTGKRLFVHSEQGFGDTIQFVRYLPMAKRLGGTVAFETFRPLLGLFHNMPGIDELKEISPDRRYAETCDYYVPLMSLPRLFMTAGDTIPFDMPYIHTDPRKRENSNVSSF